MDTKAVATESALIVVTGIAKKYLVKPSVAVRTFLKGHDGNGPGMSICMRSPGKDFKVETSCRGVLSLEVCTCFIWRHVEQFLK